MKHQLIFQLNEIGAYRTTYSAQYYKPIVLFKGNISWRITLFALRVWNNVIFQVIWKNFLVSKLSHFPLTYSEWVKKAVILKQGSFSNRYPESFLHCLYSRNLANDSHFSEGLQWLQFSRFVTHFTIISFPDSSSHFKIIFLILRFFFSHCSQMMLWIPTGCMTWSLWSFIVAQVPIEAITFLLSNHVDFG